MDVRYFIWFSDFNSYLYAIIKCLKEFNYAFLFINTKQNKKLNESAIHRKFMNELDFFVCFYKDIKEVTLHCHCFGCST